MPMDAPHQVPFHRASSFLTPFLLPFLLGGLTLMADSPAAPNPKDPKTIDDLNSTTALNLAQAAAWDAQIKALASKKALDAALGADDPIAAQLAAATQRANLSAQQKAVSENQAAILKTKFTVPDSGYSGDIKPGDKAGNVEAALLTARALNLAAASVAEGLEKTTVPSVVLYGGTDLPDFQALLTYSTQFKTIEMALDAALASLQNALDEAKVNLGPIPETVLPSPALIGLGLDAANKILGFFRTDYAIQGVAVSPDQLLLVNALAGALTKKNIGVRIPALFNGRALHDESPILANLQTLNEKRSRLQEKINAAGSQMAAWAAAAENGTNLEKKKAMSDTLARLKVVNDQGKVSLALHDALLSKLTTLDDKARLPLAAIIQQEAVRSELKAGAYLMTARISTAGGTYYTRKNLWSFFGTMPFFTMGGVVLDYCLFNGSTGIVVKAGAVPLSGGFFKVKNLPRDLQEPPAHD